MSDLCKLRVSGKFENLVKIADFISETAARAGLDEKASYAVQMAVDEACTNIIEHAYGGEGKGEIRLACTIKRDGLQIVITDQGQSFDPHKIPKLNTQAPLSKRKQRGMGIFFIRNLVDELEYKFNTPQGNQLILLKHRK